MQTASLAAENAAVREVLKFMNGYFWNSTSRNLYAEVYSSYVKHDYHGAASLIPPAAGAAQDSGANTREAAFRHRLLGLVRAALPHVSSPEDVRVVELHEVSALPVSVTVPEKGSASSHVPLGKALLDAWPSALDPTGQIRALAASMAAEYPLFYHYVFLQSVPAWHRMLRMPYDAAEEDGAGESGWLCADALYHLWLRATGGVGAAAALAATAPTVSVTAALGLGAMAGLRDLARANAAVVGGDSLAWARRLGDLYSFAYHRCLFVPQGLTAYERASARRRRVLMGLERASDDDDFADPATARVLFPELRHDFEPDPLLASALRFAAPSLPEMVTALKADRLLSTSMWNDHVAEALSRSGLRLSPSPLVASEADPDECDHTVVNENGKTESPLLLLLESGPFVEFRSYANVYFRASVPTNRFRLTTEEGVRLLYYVFVVRPSLLQRLPS